MFEVGLVVGIGGGVTANSNSNSKSGTPDFIACTSHQQCLDQAATASLDKDIFSTSFFHFHPHVQKEKTKGEPWHTYYDYYVYGKASDDEFEQVANAGVDSSTELYCAKPEGKDKARCLRCDICAYKPLQFVGIDGPCCEACPSIACPTEAPNTDAGATMRDDPHAVDPHGGGFDFRGEDGATYNLVSHSNTSVNARFEHVDYRSKAGKLIHGSYMREVYVTSHTNTSRAVHIEYASKKPLTAQVSIGKDSNEILTTQRMSVDNVLVSLDNRTLKVETPDWVILARSKVNPGIIGANSCATGRCFLSVSVRPQFDERTTAAAPHGLLGQSYDGDGVGIQGAIDNYNSKADEFTTSANGEGAIEGKAADYKMFGKFETNFAFSRFGKKSALPRNISTLTGKKVQNPTHGVLPLFE
jgi:hypothetical protein